MKSIIKKVLVIAILACLPIFTFAQPQPPNNSPGGGAPGSGNTPVGGSAPIGSGIALLISLAAMYGSKKVFDARKKLME
ncbi:MAG: hypothetical protein HPY80_05800 [Bacteroidales bacterium]|nr:hypothetical protein [Bacteroidales bacterium]